MSSVHNIFHYLQAVAREVEVQAEDEQAFLARHQAQLQAGGPGAPNATQGRQESPLRQSPAVQKTSDRRVSSTGTPNQIGSPKKVRIGESLEGSLEHIRITMSRDIQERQLDQTCNLMWKSCRRQKGRILATKYSHLLAMIFSGFVKFYLFIFLLQLFISVIICYVAVVPRPLGDPMMHLRLLI